MLAGVAIMEGVLNLAGTRDQVPRGILVAATYTMNIPGFGHGTYLLNHLWTLANEEQFYLIWPVVLVIAVLWKRPALVVTACVVVVYFTMLATLLLSYPDVASVYTFPTSWTIAMIIGAAAQIWRSHIETILRGRAAAALAVAGGLGLLALAMIPRGQGRHLDVRRGRSGNSCAHGVDDLWSAVDPRRRGAGVATRLARRNLLCSVSVELPDRVLAGRSRRGPSPPSSSGRVHDCVGRGQLVSGGNAVQSLARSTGCPRTGSRSQTRRPGG